MGRYIKMSNTFNMLFLSAKTKLLLPLIFIGLVTPSKDI